MLVLKLGQKTKVGNNPVHNELSVYTAIVKQPLVPRVSQNPIPVVKLKSSMNSKNWKTPQPMSTDQLLLRGLYLLGDHERRRGRGVRDRMAVRHRHRRALHRLPPQPLPRRLRQGRLRNGRILLLQVREDRPPPEGVHERDALHDEDQAQVFAIKLLTRKISC